MIAAITNPDPSAWQPIAFRSYRNDQISEGLKPNDLVRSGPDGGIYRLKLITSNNSWQATTGKLVPIAPGWQFLRPIPPVGTAVEISTSKGWNNGYLLEVASPDAAMVVAVAAVAVGGQAAGQHGDAHQGDEAASDPG